MPVKASSNERADVLGRIAKHVSIQKCFLENADFCVLNKDGHCVYMVERKTHADLCASFASGHLQDQLARLQDEQSRTGARALLLVESQRGMSWSPTSPTSPSSLPDKALSSCLFKLQLSGLPVVCVTCVEETGLFLKYLADRATAAKPEPAKPTDVLGEAVPVARTARAKRATRADVLCAMLQAIPGISKSRADAILGKRGGELANLLKKPLAPDEFKGSRIGKATVESVNRILFSSDAQGK